MLKNWIKQIFKHTNTHTPPLFYRTNLQLQQHIFSKSALVVSCLIYVCFESYFFFFKFSGWGWGMGCLVLGILTYLAIPELTSTIGYPIWLLILTYLEYSVKLIYFRFSWPQRFHCQEFSKYTTYTPQIYRGRIFLQDKSTHSGQCKCIHDHPPTVKLRT